MKRIHLFIIATVISLTGCQAVEQIADDATNPNTPQAVQDANRAAGEVDEGSKADLAAKAVKDLGEVAGVFHPAAPPLGEIAGLLILATAGAAAKWRHHAKRNKQLSKVIQVANEQEKSPKVEDMVSNELKPIVRKALTE